MEEAIRKICEEMGMRENTKENPFGCGTFFAGDKNISQGYFWYLVYEKHFIITKCDFLFCRDTKVTLPANSIFIALRLDYARHLPPGKILAFLEEEGRLSSVRMKEGARVAYTEVLYIPLFYRKHLNTMFTAKKANPIEILKNMGGEHNWSSEMMDSLIRISKCEMTGISAELFYIAEAYRLMSAVLEMGSGRLPKKSTDYEDILRVIQYIDQHYTETIRQEALVRLAKMSPTKLKNLFRQFTGSAITDYILTKKADRAAHLLSDTDLSVEEIASMLGFHTVSGFSTSFKKKMGIPPSEYRKQMEFICYKNPSSGISF
ncbi:MAG: AraC family transcriptional regulator [Johnsonella sp.]|nr:AraC family transcriptional regulator [Johnsonella sp.]